MSLQVTSFTKNEGKSNIVTFKASKLVSKKIGDRVVNNRVDTIYFFACEEDVYELEEVLDIEDIESTFTIRKSTSKDGATFNWLELID